MRDEECARENLLAGARLRAPNRAKIEAIA